MRHLYPLGRVLEIRKRREEDALAELRESQRRHEAAMNETRIVRAHLARHQASIAQTEHELTQELLGRAAAPHEFETIDMTIEALKHEETLLQEKMHKLIQEEKRLAEDIERFRAVYASNVRGTRKIQEHRNRWDVQEKEFSELREEQETEEYMSSSKLRSQMRARRDDANGNH